MTSIYPHNKHRANITNIVYGFIYSSRGHLTIWCYLFFTPVTSLPHAVMTVLGGNMLAVSLYIHKDSFSWQVSGHDYNSPVSSMNTHVLAHNYMKGFIFIHSMPRNIFHIAL